jgi:hypothetical protein
VDDGSWQTVEPFNSFTQQDPVEGAPATKRTDVRILVGHGHVFVGIICYDSDPSRIIMSQARRDAALTDTDAIISCSTRSRTIRTPFIKVIPYVLGSANKDYSWSASTCMTPCGRVRQRPPWRRELLRRRLHRARADRRRACRVVAHGQCPLDAAGRVAGRRRLRDQPRAAEGELFFHHLASVKGLLQYNGQTAQFSSNIRLTLLKRSGTGLFVVYNDRRDTSSRFRPEQTLAVRSL